jgi:YidC/Oxa1 family membrane protein insertase
MKISSSLSLAFLATYCGDAAAFSQLKSHQRISFMNPLNKGSNSELRALPFSMAEVNDLHTSAAASFDSMYHTFASSNFLADAAAEAVDAAQDDGGLWQSYLNIYKSLLVGVHSTVEGPLKNSGWDQTWGVSIFLFTAGVRSLLIPLSVQQTKSSEYMKALKPYQNEINEKFKDDQNTKNRLTAKLFEDADQNPLAGCLVSIFQLPILLGLYRSITMLAKDGELNEPFLWIPSLEGPVTPPTYRGVEWLTEGWTSDGSFPVPSLGWETTLAFLIMPVILVLGQKLTMSVLTPGPDENASDEEKEQFEKTSGFLKFLPLLIGFFSLQVPSALTIYWATSNSFTLLQSLAVRTYYKANPPKIELPEYWDNLDKSTENMSPDQMREAATQGIAVGPTMEDFVDQARFHYVVDRTPMRVNSEAWERAQANGDVPAEMSSWVASESVVSETADMEPAKL